MRVERERKMRCRCMKYSPICARGAIVFEGEAIFFIKTPTRLKWRILPRAVHLTMQANQEWINRSHQPTQCKRCFIPLMDEKRSHAKQAKPILPFVFFFYLWIINLETFSQKSTKNIYIYIYVKKRANCVLKEPVTASAFFVFNSNRWCIKMSEWLSSWSLTPWCRGVGCKPLPYILCVFVSACVSIKPSSLPLRFPFTENTICRPILNYSNHLLRIQSDPQTLPLVSRGSVRPVAGGVNPPNVQY